MMRRGAGRLACAHVVNGPDAICIDMNRHVG